MLTSWMWTNTSRSRIALYGLALFAFVTFLVLGWRSELREKLLGLSSLLSKRPSIHQSDIFHWDTLSAFRPVRQDIEGKSTEELCKTFPYHLLQSIQPVLKTGHGLLEARLRPQLQSVSACLDTLVIVSDVNEQFEGRQIIDIIADLREGFKDDNEQLVVSGYFVQKAFADNGTLKDVTPTEVGVQGWELDKFKFLPQVSRIWRMRPEKRWYVFFEADTFIVWDNIFRLLSNFNPDVPLYFGSPSPSREGSWMANGGPGYVLSREAARRLVKDDFETNGGAFLGSKLSERWEDEMMGNCCGDSVLGWALHEDGTLLSGLWPMFNPHPLHAMHKTSAVDMIGLWRWEESRRARRPLLYADLPEYLNLTTIPTRDDWNNAGWDGYLAPHDTAHGSFQACGEACRASAECFQWTYHLRSCQFVRSFRLGEAKTPEAKGTIESVQVHDWSNEDKRFMAGWDLDAIRHWMDGKGRDCQTVHDTTAFVYSTDVWPEAQYLLPRSRKGREAAAYLSYILDYYDALPRYTFFVHAAEDQWHNDIFSKYNNQPRTISNFRIAAIDARGFVNLRGRLSPSCPVAVHPLAATDLDMKVLDPGRDYADIYTEIFNVSRKNVPETIGAVCCAQFAVSRDRIRNRPREEYEHILRWAEETTWTDSFGVGLVFEKLWHIIFGMTAVQYVHYAHVW
ncbi:hypothetical protein LTS10_000017 [Elasticomyces elasticus]|nr:hypothetical protein LTS10_000017 [Elasticomyces elasticus]